MLLSCKKPASLLLIRVIRVFLCLYFHAQAVCLQTKSYVKNGSFGVIVILKTYKNCIFSTIILHVCSAKVGIIYHISMLLLQKKIKTYMK